MFRQDVLFLSSLPIYYTGSAAKMQMDWLCGPTGIDTFCQPTCIKTTNNTYFNIFKDISVKVL